MKLIFIGALLIGFGIVVGLLFSPVILGNDSRQIESERAKGFMLGLACNKKKREWVIDGRSPCQ